MLATYGLDVLDPAVTPRRIWRLLERLPAGAWPNSTSPSSWSVEAHLLATVVDRLGDLTYVTLRTAGAKSAKQPKALPRPGSRAPARPPGGITSAPAPSSGPKTSWGDFARALMGEAAKS